MCRIGMGLEPREGAEMSVSRAVTPCRERPARAWGRWAGSERLWVSSCRATRLCLGARASREAKVPRLLSLHSPMSCALCRVLETPAVPLKTALQRPDETAHVFASYASNRCCPEIWLWAPFDHFVCSPMPNFDARTLLGNFTNSHSLLLALCKSPVQASSPFPALLHSSPLLLFINLLCMASGEFVHWKSKMKLRSSLTHVARCSQPAGLEQNPARAANPPRFLSRPAQLIAFYFSLWCCY